MIKHKHHIIPRHAGGSDVPSNLVELSLTEHAEAHRILYEKDKNYKDFLAWKMLSGQIPACEASRLATIYSNKTRTYSLETREKLAKAMRGKKLSGETKSKISKSNKGKNTGKVRSKETREKISESKKGIPLVFDRSNRRKEYTITDPHGNTFVVVGLKEFCKNYNLWQPYVSEVVSGKRPHYKGYIISCNKRI